MIGRHIIFAGLFAAASFANAGTVEASSATVQPAWSFNAGVAGAAPAAQSMIAGPGSWSAHSRMGDVGSSSTMLFSQSGPANSAPAQLSTSAVAAPAPAELANIVANDDTAGTGGTVVAAVDAADIPEPATGMLMLAGLLGAGFMRRRRT